MEPFIWSSTSSDATFALPRHCDGHLELALEHFAVDGRLRRDGNTLFTSFDEWASIGRTIEHVIDDEEREDARAKLDALSALCPPEPALQVRLVGLWGNDRSSLRVKVAGGTSDIDLTPAWPHVDGQPLPLTPGVASVLATIKAYNTTSATARIEAGLLLRRRASDANVQIELPRAMPDKPLRRAVALRIDVDDAKLGDGSLTVMARVEDDTGTLTDVNTRTLANGFVEGTAGTVALSLAQRAAITTLQRYKAVAPNALGDAREHPELLLPPEAIDDSMQFAGYSERVQGFAAVVPLPPTFSSSGIQWHEDVDDSEDEDEAFAIVRIHDAADGRLHRLRFYSAETLVAARDDLQSAINATPDDAVRWRGVLVADPQRVLDGIAARFAVTGTGHRRAASLLDADERVRGSTSWHEPDTALLQQLLAPGVQPLPHQVEGLRWLWSRYVVANDVTAPRGVLLADDMGLGKTFQMACLMALARRRDPRHAPHLVVAPKILLENWQAELRKYFVPRTLSARIVTAEALRPGRGGLVNDAGKIDERALLDDDVWLLSYDTLQSYGPALLRPDWHIVVLDEAQAIKNPVTARSRNARGLKARFSIASTGTPIENATSDLYAIADFACPGVLASSRSDFDARYPDRDSDAAGALRRVLAIDHDADALLLRREKSVALRDLPPKRTVVAEIPMSPAQRELESQLVQDRTRGGAFERLGLLQKLYQHPSLLDASAHADNEPMAVLMAASPKLAWLHDTLRAIANANEKVLVFTVWSRMQGIIVRLLTALWPSTFEHRNVVINGVPQNMASAHTRIAAFSARSGFDALVMSPLAAGTGLTITAATHVIHYGRWWNPAREDQATDRAHRIGQTRPVTVWVPVLHHPGNVGAGFDVGLHRLVERKRALARDFLSPAPLDVTDDDWAALQGS